LQLAPTNDKTLGGFKVFRTIRKISALLVSALAVGVLLLLPACENLLTEEDDGDNGLSPLETLSGRWTITELPWDDVHFTLVFNTDRTYAIEDGSGTVFENGPVENVTSSSLYYTIEQYDLDDSLDVPADNYAEYEINGDHLTITFYDDDTKEIAFGTVEAQRVYLSLVYQGEIDGSPGSYEKWVYVTSGDIPMDVWHGDAPSATASDTADYIWLNLTDDSDGTDVSSGSYALSNGMTVAADATDAQVASDGSVSQPATYYDTRAQGTGPNFTRDEIISDATLTVDRSGELYLLTLSYTFESGGTLDKYFELPVTNTYDVSGN
jgi:hypothetical protein